MIWIIDIWKALCLITSAIPIYTYLTVHLAPLFSGACTGGASWPNRNGL